MTLLIEINMDSYAKTDTIGLQEFYERNKANYLWPERADIIIASNAKKKTIKSIQKQFEKGISIEQIEKELEAAKSGVIITKDVVNKDHQLLPNTFKFKQGVSEIYQHNNAYHVALVNKILPESNKTLDEAKGFVITDFQEAKENEWLQSLRNKYNVSINKTTLKSVKSAVKQ